MGSACASRRAWAWHRSQSTPGVPTTRLFDVADAAIARATIGLAHTLKLSVVAEGVEDELTWEALNTLGCDPRSRTTSSADPPQPQRSSSSSRRARCNKPRSATRPNLHT